MFGHWVGRIEKPEVDATDIVASESAASFRRTRVERYSAETKGRTLEAIGTDRRDNVSLAD
jgi:hypothetical protein